MHSNKKSSQSQETKPISFIMTIKSNDDLKGYLEQRPQLNLSIMKEKNQSTLLHYAAFKNELPKMKIFILHYEAFHKRNKSNVSFQSLLKAWINHQNSDGFAAIHFATLHGNVEMIQFLERYGANMQVQSNQKQNILFMCAQNNHIKAAIYLLEHRQGKIPFNVNDVNHIGDTILHKASKHGFSNFASYLINYDGLDVNAKNNEGMTPLMLAVSGGHKQIVKRMLLKGINRHLVNNEQKKAIDLAKQLGKNDIAKILNDEYSCSDKIKISCNIKIVYEVQKPSIKQCILFLFLFHLVFLPTNTLIEVDLFGQDYYYIFYGIVGLYYLIIIILFGLLTKKHPKKPQENLLDVQMPFCPQCRSHIKTSEFHCFICGKCISRYDHHCPWINNCVSSYNIGKFTTFVFLLILGSMQVMFMSVTFYFDALEMIKPNRFFTLPEEDSDAIYLANTILSSIIAAFFCFSLTSLLVDQCKNLFSNTTSFERAKNLRKSTLLQSLQQNVDAINNDNTSEVSVQSDDSQTGCFTNCCTMLKQPYGEETD